MDFWKEMLLVLSRQRSFIGSWNLSRCLRAGYKSRGDDLLDTELSRELLTPHREEEDDMDARRQTNLERGECLLISVVSDAARDANQQDPHARLFSPLLFPVLLAAAATLLLLGHCAATDDLLTSAAPSLSPSAPTTDSKRFSHGYIKKITPLDDIINLMKSNLDFLTHLEHIFWFHLFKHVLNAASFGSGLS